MTQDRLDRAIYVLDTLLRRELASDVREALTIVLEAVERMRNKEAFSNYIGDTMATINTPISHTEYTMQLVAGTDVHGKVWINTEWVDKDAPSITDGETGNTDQGLGKGDQGPRTDAQVTLTGVSGEGQA